MAITEAVTGGSCRQSLTLPWHTWKPAPLAGDLCVVVSTVPFTPASPDWSQATPDGAYALYRPGAPEPAFSADIPEGTGWSVHGFIAQPEREQQSDQG